jgi:hypothetical protein
VLKKYFICFLTKGFFHQADKWVKAAAIEGEAAKNDYR